METSTSAETPARSQYCSRSFAPSTSGTRRGPGFTDFQAELAGDVISERSRPELRDRKPARRDHQDRSAKFGGFCANDESVRCDEFPGFCCSG